MDDKEKIQKKRNNISIIDDAVFFIVIVLLALLAISIIWQRFFIPEKIPTILGYKFFMVMDGKMDESIGYGDLLITHDIDPDILKKNDVVAFRNNTNRVTVHRIEEITRDKEGRQFVMKTASNEVGDTKYVRDSQIEGSIIRRIPKIGAIMVKIQEPPIFLTILFIVLVVGMTVYYLAWKLDKRDMERIVQN